MPLSEFYEASLRGRKIDSAQTKGSNCPSSLSFVSDNEFVELLWENGEIVMQGKSSRPRKDSAAPTTFPLPEDNGKDGAPISATKMNRIENVNSLVYEFSPSDPSSNVRMNVQFDRMVPWVNYPIEDPSSSDYCSDFFSEFPGVVMPAQRNNPIDQNNIEDSNVGRGTVAKSIGDESDPSRITTMHQSTSAYQNSFVNSTARIENLAARGGCRVQQGTSGNLLSTKSQKEYLASTKPQQVSISPDSVNFFRFSKPGALAKVNLQRIERLKINEDSPAAASSNHIESSVIDSSCGLQSTSIIQGQKGSASAMSELRSSAKKSNNMAPIKRSDVFDEDMPRKNPNISTTDIAKVNLRSPNQNNCYSLDLAAGVSLGRSGIEKDNEAIAASSVCSDNTAGTTSDDNKQSTKRKIIQEGEESGNHIQDLEGASAKKPVSVKSTSAKRTRAAEVHNLSERRRRDRINEKMRALQELIPNCSKVDKASMLDEAIEYLKTLQLQVQMMSMGSGLCVPPMLLPYGMQHMRVPPLVHLPRMGVGMGMDMRFGYGMGMLNMNGSPGCSLIPTPPMHATQFPSAAVPGQQGLYGTPQPTNLHMFGRPTTVLPMTVPQVPQFNFMPGHSANSNTLPEASNANANSLQAPNTAPSSNCKDQQTNANDSQGTKESSQQCPSNQTSSGSEDETDN